MDATSRAHVSNYLRTLRATANLDGPLAPVLFLTMTTLARPRELLAPETACTPSGMLTMHNTVGLADTRQRVIPLSAAAAQTMQTLGGLDALKTTVGQVGQTFTHALQRSLDDIEGLGDARTADAAWQLAVTALVVATPPSLTYVVFRYAGLGKPAAAAQLERPAGPIQVAAAIDDLVRRAGFDVNFTAMRPSCRSPSTGRCTWWSR